MQQITSPLLKSWMKANKDFLLLDIREDREWEAFNIGGEHIPMGDIPAKTGLIPRDKDVVLVCEKGIRSVITIQRLEGLGFQNLINLSGGLKAWRAETE